MEPMKRWACLRRIARAQRVLWLCIFGGICFHCGNVVHWRVHGRFFCGHRCDRLKRRRGVWERLLLCKRR